MTTSTTNRPNLAYEFPDANLHLKDIVKTLPRECFQHDIRKAWISVLTSVFMVSLGYVGIAIAPGFLYPIVDFTGTALTGFL
jgi:omega-6 fatty acid desaturase (delta-12 desaturase)